MSAWAGCWQIIRLPQQADAEAPIVLGAYPTLVDRGGVGVSRDSVLHFDNGADEATP